MATTSSASMPQSAFVTTSDGVVLALRRWPAAGERRAVALLVHAMMANAAYLAPFAAALAADGIEAWTLDLRGHGASVPPWPRRDRWGFSAYVERDLPAALAHTGADVYLGHSLGGLAGVAAFASGAAPPPRRLVLVATTPWTRGVAAQRATVEALVLAARPLGYLPVRRLGLGTDDENLQYLTDFANFVRSDKFCENPQNLTMPTLVVVGGKDRLCRPEDARAIADSLSGPVRWRTARASGHFGFFRDASLAREIADFMKAR
jgi:predicted alpha/beta hydrolase